MTTAPTDATHRIVKRGISQLDVEDLMLSVIVARLSPARMNTSRSPVLGNVVRAAFDLLVQNGVITPDHIEQAYEQARDAGLLPRELEDCEVSIRPEDYKGYARRVGIQPGDTAAEERARLELLHPKS